MTDPDLSRLSPQDALVALRSYPRRYASELEGFVGDDTPDELAGRIGPDGTSTLQIVSDVTRTWAVLDGAFGQVLVQDDPMLHPAVVDARLRHWDAAPPDTVSEALTLLGHEADALAGRIEGVLAASDWSRTGSVAGGGSVTSLDLVRDAVAVGASGLIRIRSTLASVRR